MRNHILTIGVSVICLSAMAPSAFAQTSSTVHEPDNGFAKGSDPEWAALHAKDTHGTETHRQYHRDGVKAHLLWHEQHRAEQGTPAYAIAHRLFHQQRNELHRQSHTAPTNP